MLNFFLCLADLHDLEEFPVDLVNISLQLVIPRFVDLQVVINRFKESFLTDHLTEDGQGRLFDEGTDSILQLESLILLLSIINIL
jgi:hypothetical protein